MFMAKNLLNKYVWLVDTIHKAKRISFEEINKRWLDNDISEGKPLSIRTFHKWRIAIEEMFGLIIENEQEASTAISSRMLTNCGAALCAVGFSIHLLSAT